MRALGVFLASCLICGPALAETVYECDITRRESKNIPEKIFVEFDPAMQTATAIDEFVKHYVGEPIEAKVVKNSDKRLTVSYTLEDITAKHGGTILKDQTKLTIIKASGEAIVSYTQGYGYVNNGNGSCKVVN